MPKITIQTNNFQNSDNETGQDFSGAEIDTLNNFYSSKIFKPFKGKIENRKVHKNVLNWANIKGLLFVSLLSSFGIAIFALAILKIYSDIKIGMYELYLYTKMFFFIIFVPIIFFKSVQWYFSDLKISINENEIVLHEKGDDKKINFGNIRSYLKMNDLIGYSIYIYGDDKIFPEIEFSVQSLHLANSIEELLLNKIKD